MNNELNIAEILKNCQKGTPLYSPICGECELDNIFCDSIVVKLKSPMTDYFGEIHFMSFTSKGYYGGDNRNDIGQECLLFPSKENRDWTKFNRNENNHTKLDDFKPFDKVLVRNATDEIWRPRLFAYYGYTYSVCTDGNDYQFCVPYRKETAHLLGTVKDYD